MPEMRGPLRAGLHDFGLAAKLGPAGWFVLVRAVFELARARYRLGSRNAQDLLRQPFDLLSANSGGSTSFALLSPSQRQLIDRMGFAIPRLGVRVPWRADCLVQALAAQRWLASAGIGSMLCLGVRRDVGAAFEAHAWLRVDEQVVVGGDIADFTLLFSQPDHDAHDRQQP